MEIPDKILLNKKFILKTSLNIAALLPFAFISQKSMENENPNTNDMGECIRLF
jgi:hypothetical protein